MKKLFGVVGGALVASMAACTTEIDPAETEEVGTVSSALGERYCAGDYVKAATATSGVCSTATDKITSYDVALLKLRAQAYFSYVMGGSLPPTWITVNGTSYRIRDDHWDDYWYSSSARLCMIRRAVEQGRITVNPGGTVSLCGYNVNVFKFSGSANNSDRTACDFPNAQPNVGVGVLIANISRFSSEERGWCTYDGDNLPSFWKVKYTSDTEVDVDPETVVLSGSLSNTISATAAGVGKDTSADYKVVRWPSTGGSCSSIKTLIDASPLGLPCKTESGTGETGKYIQKSASGYCYCRTPS